MGFLSKSKVFKCLQNKTKNNLASRKSNEHHISSPVLSLRGGIHAHVHTFPPRSSPTASSLAAWQLVGLSLSAAAAGTRQLFVRPIPCSGGRGIPVSPHPSPSVTTSGSPDAAKHLLTPSHTLLDTLNLSLLAAHTATTQTRRTLTLVLF